MNNTPQHLKDKWNKEPKPQCERWEDGECSGRMTKEHAWIYAGKQIQEDWAIIDLCWYHHLGDGLDKDLNHYIALLRADLDDLCARMPKKDWKREFIYLSSLYEEVL